MKNLIVDYIPFEVSPQQVNESLKENDGKLVVKGVLQRADAKNQNGRVYPKDILMREADKYNDGFIKQKRALGELDHPDSSVVNLQNVSHNIKDLWWDGDNIMGKIEILPTPSGNILKSLVDSGITVGVSSRGMGTLKPMGEVQEVQDDFELLCWDFVSTPSNPGSYMAISEGKQNNTIQNKYHKVNSIITEILCAQGNCPIL